MKPDLTYWKRKLAGEAPPITAEDPQHGYYRLKNDAVVIKPDGNGGAIVSVNGVDIDDPHRASDIWVSCAKHAIDQEIYGRWVETRVWPEQEAMIKKSSSLNKNLKELAALADKAALKLAERDQKIDATDPDGKSLRMKGVTTLTSQLEADTAAGYVQQIRAMVGEAEDTVKLQLAPIKEQEKEIRRIWVDPFDKLEELKKYFLSKLTEYGKKVVRESNNPDFKFAAGKAGDGKTIALRKKEVLTLDDKEGSMKKLVARFGKDEKVIKAYHDAIMAAATTAWKAEKKAPDGTKVVIDYDAV